MCPRKIKYRRFTGGRARAGSQNQILQSVCVAIVLNSSMPSFFRHCYVLNVIMGQLCWGRRKACRRDHAGRNHFQPAEVLTAPSRLKAPKFAFEPQSETSARDLPTDPSHYTNGRRMLEASIRIMNIPLWQYAKHMTASSHVAAQQVC